MRQGDRGGPRSSDVPVRHPTLFQASFSIALVEPEYSLNVGYVARVAGNFGLSNLIIVTSDRGRINLEEAAKFASHASQLVSNMKTVNSFGELRRMFDILIGTTAIMGRRKSNITRKSLDVLECAKRIAQIVREGNRKRICLVLGRDTTGLTNAELKQCDFTATIQTGSSYNTLNVSHATAILLFAFHLHLGGVRGKSSRIPGPRRTKNNREQKELVVRLFGELASESEFQRFKREKLKEAVSRLLNRSDPSLRELYLLMGAASRATSKLRRLSRVKQAKID